MRDEASEFQQISSNTTIKENKGILRSIFVSSASNTPQITVYDGTSTGGTTIAAQWTPTAGEEYLTSSVHFESGLFVEIGGDVQCSVFYQ